MAIRITGTVTKDRHPDGSGAQTTVYSISNPTPFDGVDSIYTIQAGGKVQHIAGPALGKRYNANPTRLQKFRRRTQ